MTIKKQLESTATISVPDAVHLLGIGRGSAYAAAQRGEVPTLRIGNRLVVPTAPLIKLLGLE